jgi:hypothetical protein
MADLSIYIPNHGFADGDLVWVSWLKGNYYVVSSRYRSFKISSVSGGTPIQADGVVREGYVKKVDPSLNSTTVSNMEHLAGDSSLPEVDRKLPITVDVVSGETWWYFDNATGSFTLPRDVTNYSAGLRYKMEITTMRLEAPSVNGLQGRIKRIAETVVRYIKSKLGYAGTSYGGTEYLSNLYCEYSTATKDATIQTQGGFDPDGKTLIKHLEPYPFTILCVVDAFSVDEE